MNCRNYWLSVKLILSALISIHLCGAGGAQASVSTRDGAPRLALLVSSAINAIDKKAMPNDMIAVKDALLTRGFSKDNILSLDLSGTQRRQALIDFLKNAHNKIADWTGGEVFLFFTGHGEAESCSSCNAERPRLQLADDESLNWDEVFSLLNVPRKVDLVVLPDC